MDVRLSSEQQALRDSVTQVADRLGAKAVGQLADVERAGKLAAAVAASGWLELRCPEDGGAPLASGVEAAIVAEELGRSLADTPYIGPTLAAELRRLAGAPYATAAETVLLGPGLGEPATTPLGAVAIDAQGASSALLLVPGDGGFGLADVGLKPLDGCVDLTRPSAVPAGAPTAVPGQERALTDDDLTSWTVLGLALACADLVGVMRGAVALSTEYASSRKQYGTAIGSFQAVQHLLADAFVAMEGARSVARHAAWAVDALPPGEALAAGSVAKAYCARAARSVCETAVQVHGGIGNTWECQAHVFLRRALLSSDVLGGAGANLTRVLALHGVER
jgi:alkylation response protein AidB-like acyl-CoA dehydrogenase